MTSAADFGRFVRIATIVRDTIKNGGGTWDTNGHEVTSGICVSGEIEERVVSEVAFCARIVDDFMALNEGRAVGTWVHEGNVYLDAVTILTDRKEALALGKERGEIAIFDLDLMEEIFL